MPLDLSSSMVIGVSVGFAPGWNICASIIGPAWINVANAVLSPVLGPLTEDLAGLQGRNSGMFGGGWYGYVDKDLRTLLGSRVRDPFNLRYCGEGSLKVCRDSLWYTVHAAADQLAAQFGNPDPATWLKTASRTGFQPGRVPGSPLASGQPADC